MATSAKAQQNPYSSIGIHPITGPLDTRSRPADLPAGALRWKLNYAMTRDGKLCRRGGFDRYHNEAIYDGPGAGAKLLTDPTHTGSQALYHNHDLHAQGITRHPLTCLYENTRQDGVRELFAGTGQALFHANPDTGYWTTLIAGAAGSASSRWRAASLQGLVFFTNGVNPPVYWDSNTSTFHNTIPSMITGVALNLPVGKSLANAQVVIEFAGFLLLMNLTDSDGHRYPTRIAWSDMNNGLCWVTGGKCDPADALDSVAGYQDLPYGQDEIIAAVPLLGSLYIFTRRSIWRMYVSNSSDPAAVFGFERKYNEPKNQAGCLVYPHTLISTGQELYYMGRETIYRYAPTLLVPEAEDSLYRAAGVIYRKSDTAIDAAQCNGPCAEYVPTLREMWFSWPSSDNNPSGLNNWTFVFQTDQKTADVVDHGFTCFVNYRETPAVGQCNEVQDFLAASSRDWAIKDLGNSVWYRKLLTDSLSPSYDPTVDPALDDPAYSQTAYNSLLRGLVPTGYFDRDKTIRKVHIEDDTTPEPTPCRLNIRLGQSYSVQDPNEGQSHTSPGAVPGGENLTCSVLWQDLWRDATTGEVGKPLTCSDALTMAQMKAKNLKPAQGKDYPVFLKARYCYFEVSITQPPVPGAGVSSGDSCLEQITFEVQGCPKPL